GRAICSGGGGISNSWMISTCSSSSDVNDTSSAVISGQNAIARKCRTVAATIDPQNQLLNPAFRRSFATGSTYPVGMGSVPLAILPPRRACALFEVGGEVHAQGATCTKFLRDLVDHTVWHFAIRTDGDHQRAIRLLVCLCRDGGDLVHRN